MKFLRRFWAYTKRKLSSNDNYEYDFLPDVLAVMETPPSRASRMLLWTILTFFGTAVLWSIFAEMDVVATAYGKLDPIGSVKVVQALETSKVKGLQVKDGQFVREGDALIELDPTDPETDRRQVELEHRLALAKNFRYEKLLAAIESENTEKNDSFVDLCTAITLDEYCLEQEAVYIKELRSYKDKYSLLVQKVTNAQLVVESSKTELASSKRLLSISGENFESQKSLFSIGSISKNQWLEAKRRFLDDQSNYYSTESRLNESLSSLDTVKKELNEYVSAKSYEYYTGREEITSKIKSLELSVIKAKEREANRYLTSPVDGVVSQLKVTTVGGVVTPADILMIIVPSGTELQASVSLKNLDVGFIENGMKVNIKVDSFQYTKYGSIDGVVTTISADAVMDEAIGWVYPIKVSLNKQSIQVGEKLVPLSAGMTVAADLNIGKRPVIEYFLTNFIEYVDESFTER